MLPQLTLLLLWNIVTNWFEVYVAAPVWLFHTTTSLEIRDVQGGGGWLNSDYDEFRPKFFGWSEFIQILLSGFPPLFPCLFSSSESV